MTHFQENLPIDKGDNRVMNWLEGKKEWDIVSLRLTKSTWRMMTYNSKNVPMNKFPFYFSTYKNAGTDT